jgi:NodT family efflux transporter outer membrane factor (OMF) lipoprotein
VESADASLEASIEDYRDVLVILFADVAQAYVAVRTSEERLRYARDNVTRQKGTLEFVQNRYETGVAPKLDVTQAQRNLATTEALVPQLEEALARSVHRLGVLVGEAPSGVYPEMDLGGPIPAPPKAVSAGIPANVVRQRPDVRRAERELASQTAQVGVATAELYPQFSLSGTFARSANSSQGILDGGSKTWSLGPGFRWNLFDGGRVWNAVLAESARADQFYANYEQTVLLALEEVENAIVAYNRERVRVAALLRAVEAAAESAELVKTLYESGVADFQNVLDAERELLNQQQAWAARKGRVAANLIELYRALGGGWESGPPPPEEASGGEEEEAQGTPDQ